MVKQLLIVGVLLFGLVAQAQAGVGGFFGLSYTLGASLGNLGVTAKVISDNEEDTAIVGAGVDFYPFAAGNKFGIDISAGYLFTDFALTIGWDFLQKKPQFSAGYVNTIEDKKSSPPPATAPAPAPTSEPASTPSDEPADEGGET